MAYNSYNFNTINNEATNTATYLISQYANENLNLSNTTLQGAIFYYCDQLGNGREATANALGCTCEDIDNAILNYHASEIRFEYESTGNVSNCINDIEYLVQTVGLAEASELTNLTEDQLRSAQTTNIDTLKNSFLNDYEQSSSNVLTEDNPNSENNHLNIQGAPFRLNKVTDPNQSWYYNTIYTDMYTVGILPGLPVMRDTYKKNNDNNDEDVIFNRENVDVSDAITELGSSLLLSNVFSDEVTQHDQRFYTFSSAKDAFLKQYRLMLYTVGTKMGFDLGTLFSNSGTGTGNFLQDILYQSLKFSPSSISISEDVSNSFGPSNVAGAATQVSDMAKEVSFLLGDNMQNIMNGTKKFGKKISDKLESIKTDSKSILDTLIGGASSTIDVLSTAIAGSNVYFPEIWKDSQFSRSINMEFKFSTPYGSKNAIFNYVYVPFLLLLTLSLPREDTIMGYKSPYICRLDLPGMFTSDMAVVTSMSYKKGGEQNLWSKDGYPLEITVSMSFKDLYPVLVMANTGKELIENYSMHLFLDNMAGVSVERREPGTAFVQNIEHRLSYVMGAGQRFTDSFTQAISNWLPRG